jgi:hypothetical protein
MMVHFAAQNTQPGTVKTVADILTAAADLIEKPGAWTQGAFKRGAAGGPFSCCGVGAVYEVNRAAYGSQTAIDRLDSFAMRRGYSHFAAYNDAPERTQAEVVAALRAAAEKARTAVEDPSVGTQPGLPGEVKQSNQEKSE